MAFKGLTSNGVWEDVASGEIGEYVAIASDTYGNTQEDLQDYFIGCGKYTWGNKIYAGYPNLPLMLGEDGYNTGWYKWENVSSWEGSWDSTGCEDLDYNMYALAFRRTNSYYSVNDLSVITNINLKRIMLSVSVQESKAKVDGVENSTIFRIQNDSIAPLVGSYYLVANKQVSTIQFHQSMPVTSEWSLNGYYPAEFSINPVHQQSCGLGTDLRNNTNSYKYVEGNVYYIDNSERKLKYKTGYTWHASESSQFTFAPCLNGIITDNLINANETVQYHTLDNDVVVRSYYSTSSRDAYLTTDGFRTLRACLLHIAKLGFAFKYDNVIYKPVAQDGLIIDYTDDLSSMSEWDDWTTTDTIKRPTGGGGGDRESDDNPMTDLYSIVAGSTNIYAMTGGQVNYMMNRLNTTAVPADFDPAPTMVSLRYFPFSLSSFVTAGSNEVTWLFRMGTEGQYSKQIFPPADSDPIPAGSVVRQMRRFSLGSRHISKKQIESDLDIPFLNHECTCGLYIPFCGEVELNIDAVLDKTVSVTLAVDVVAGDCFAYVYADNNFIASASGICSCEIPISTGSYGAAKSELIAGAVKSVFSGATAAISFGQGNYGQTMASGWETGTRIARLTSNKNTAMSGPVAGSTGSLASFTGPMYCIFRISKPVPKPTTAYGHVNGYPEVETKTIGSCSGYVVCYNTDCGSIGCTDDERKLIAEKLTSGIYI